jgi:hypothetical protein
LAPPVCVTTRKKGWAGESDNKKKKETFITVSLPGRSDDKEKIMETFAGEGDNNGKKSKLFYSTCSCDDKTKVTETFAGKGDN